jgi:Fe-S cluster assembly protein SufD
MTEAFVQEFEARAGTATAEGPEWLEPVRRAALECFARTGFPAARDEEWRFTPIGPIVQGSWRPATGGAGELSREQLAPFVFGHADWTTLVFVNGVYSETLSAIGPLPAGVRVASLSEVLRADGASLQAHLTRHAPLEASPFTALNTAFLGEGGVVHVGPGVDLAAPVHLLFVTTVEAGGTVSHPRNLVVVERGARASIIESYVTLAPGQGYWTNPVTEVAVAAGAWVEHTRIQRESEQAYHVGLTHVDQQRDSHYRSFSLAMGGALARHDLHVRLNDENIETLMYGLYVTRGDQVADNHTAIYHDQPNCRSWEVYKGILDGRSRAVFNGKVFVKPEAQKTDAKQTNRNLLLSDGARVDTKPQLEIFADDVKCTHGATIGQIDPEAVFYMRSRGIAQDEARQILTYAFANEIIGRLKYRPLADRLEDALFARLGVGPSREGV